MQMRVAIGLGLQITLLASASMAAQSPSHQMTFSVSQEGFADKIVRESLENGRWSVYASGEITPETTSRFRQFVSAHGITAARINLDSPGGSLLEGLQLGLAIRDLGFDSVVSKRGASSRSPAVCASACAYAFAGGVGRFWSDHGLIGLHQFYGANSVGSVAGTQALSGLILAYLSKMGVKADAFVLAAFSEPKTVHWLSRKEASDSAFTNDGVQPTTVEVKTLDLQPYLRLQQDRHDVTIRALLTCAGGEAELAVGLVTTPETSLAHSSGNERSYIDLDLEEVLPVAGDAGVEASGSVLWIRRRVDRAFLSRLATAKTLGGHAYGGGALTWGDSMDLDGVRDQVGKYAIECRAALR